MAWSGGGPAGLQFALRHPSRISCYIHYCGVSHKWEHKITLVEKMVMTDHGLWLVSRLSKLSLAAVRKTSCKEIGLNYDHVVKDKKRLEILDAFAESIGPASLRWEGSKADIEEFSNLSRYPLENIICPTLVVHSESDNQLPISNGEFVAENVSNAEFLKFDQGGHMPQLGEEAEIVLNKMVDFLNYNSN